MEKYVIAISREYGSGGRRIGELLAEDLGVPFYDKEIIHMAAEKSGMSASFIEKSDESIPNAFLHNLKYTAYTNYDSIAMYDTPVTDKVFLAQSAVLKEIASRGSCVIVGRCADYVLRDDPGLVTIFVRASINDRLQYAIDHYNLPQEKALERIKRIDRSRTNYYKYYTSRQWGSVENFDLVINSSFTGLEGAVEIIKAMMKNKA